MKQLGGSIESERAKISGHAAPLLLIEEDMREPGRAFFYLGQILAEIASSPQPMAPSEKKPDTHGEGEE